MRGEISWLENVFVRRWILSSILIAGHVWCVACFASYTWATVWLFQYPKGQPMQMKLIGAMGVMFFIAQLFAIVRTTPSGCVADLGLFLYALAFFIFWWAVPYARRAMLNVAFTATQPARLLTDGPYRYIRHPFYASYFAFWIAGVLVSLRPWLLLSVVCMGSFYSLAIRQEETEFRQGPLRDAYKAYELATGKLLPRLIRSRDSVGAIFFALALLGKR
ncbi:MAG: isoprenylcysteine carboxylmethyltransferase family protein [Candidatus Acidiferrales bacterium]